AGSFSVSAQMASPAARGLFHRAIGESGAFFGTTLVQKTRAESEQDGAKFGESGGANSLAGLGAKPAQELLDAAQKAGPSVRFLPNVDGAFLPDTVAKIFADGKQAMAPLLAGWNADESSYRSVMRNLPLTSENLAVRLRAQFGTNADNAIKLYAA